MHAQEKCSRDASPNNCTVHVSNSAICAYLRMSMLWKLCGCCCARDGTECVKWSINLLIKTYTIFVSARLCVSVFKTVGCLTHLTLGNVFRPAPKHMIWLLARLENCNSPLKILNQGHPYWIGMTLGQVNNDRKFIFGSTIPLKGRILSLWQDLVTHGSALALNNTWP